MDSDTHDSFHLHNLKTYPEVMEILIRITVLQKRGSVIFIVIFNKIVER